jgi:RNA recognition motif-containing protein
MSSHRRNYAFSCLISVIIALFYLALFKSLFFNNLNDKTSLTISFIFIFLCGALTPLSFIFNGRFETHKEQARPDIKPEIDNIKKDALINKASVAISNNPETTARSSKKSTVSKQETTLNSQKSTKSVINKKTDNIKNAKLSESTEKPIQENNLNENTNTPIAENQIKPNIEEETVTLYISNIPKKIKANKLISIFTPFGGTIYFTRFLKKPNSYSHQGVAFVKISKDAGLKAIEELNGTLLGNQEIIVKIANERNNQTSTQKQ